MKIGPIILLVWFLMAGSSIITTVVMAFFRGARSLKWSALIVLGTLLCYGFISAGIGVGEGFWTMTSRGFQIALGIGIAGVVLMIHGVRGLIRLRPKGPQNEAQT